MLSDWIVKGDVDNLNYGKNRYNNSDNRMITMGFGSGISSKSTLPDTTRNLLTPQKSL